MRLPKLRFTAFPTRLDAMIPILELIVMSSTDREYLQIKGGKFKRAPSFLSDSKVRFLRIRIEVGIPILADFNQVSSAIRQMLTIYDVP